MSSSKLVQLMYACVSSCVNNKIVNKTVNTQFKT